VSAPGGKPAPRLSRRRFVALTGAGLAALSAGSALGATEAKPASATKSKPPAAPAAKTGTAPAMTPHQREFERQKAGTLATLKTLRAYPLPPGGDLPVVFEPMRTPKKGR
jgi:hypothetical protein